MSCSLTRISATPVYATIADRTSDPAAITSTRPGWTTGLADRFSRLEYSSSSQTRWTSAAVIRAPWMRAASYSHMPSASAATVVTDPARPTMRSGTTQRHRLRHFCDRSVDVVTRGR